MGYFDNITTTLLNKNLDGLWMRQQLTMENIANMSTPGYKSKYIDFETELKNRINQINDQGINKASKIREKFEESTYLVGENNDKTTRLDGNNVDIEKENIELTRTQYNYDYTLAELNSYFARMKMAISNVK